jgi:hypothetical protein
METLGVTFYNVVVWLHISGVVLAFGPTFAFGLYFVVGARKYPRAIPAILETQISISRTLITGGGVLVLITGLYLAGDGWEFSDFFVGWGILAILVLLGLTHGFFTPNDQRALAVAKREIDAAGPTGDYQPSKEFMDIAARNSKMGPVAGLIIIVTIYIMAAKPFL